MNTKHYVLKDLFWKVAETFPCKSPPLTQSYSFSLLFYFIVFKIVYHSWGYRLHIS